MVAAVCREPMPRGACSTCMCRPSESRCCKKPPMPIPSLRNTVEWPQPLGTRMTSCASWTHRRVLWAISKARCPGAPLRPPLARIPASISASRVSCTSAVRLAARRRSPTQSESSECCPSGAKRDRSGGMNAHSLRPNTSAFHTGPCQCIGTPEPAGPTKASKPVLPALPPTSRHSGGTTCGGSPTIEVRMRIASTSRGRLKRSGRA
eukprot:scaffold3011_cov32-Tisochrysis_lutea.AAC.1